MQKKRKLMYAVALAAALIVLVLLYVESAKREKHVSTTYAMSTIITQTVYGKNAEAAMSAVNTAFTEFENELSLYNSNSEISAINKNSGVSPVKVSAETLALVKKAVSLSSQSDNAFAITIAPISLAWGITSDNPCVLTQAETDALLPLVDDTGIVLDEAESTVYLPQKGQGIDLGGIAKGAACEIAKQIYTDYGIKSATLSIGGNVYAHGQKPDGSAFVVGFRDPDNSETASIASVQLKDKVIAVSGGYERYFEKDGKRYIHIFDPSTGFPCESNIVSVGVINEDGAKADFYSTVLYVWGKEKALDFLSTQGEGLLLDGENNLYVSKSLQDGFELYEANYNVIFI